MKKIWIIIILLTFTISVVGFDFKVLPKDEEFMPGKPIVGGTVLKFKYAILDLKRKLTENINKASFNTQNLDKIKNSCEKDEYLKGYDSNGNKVCASLQNVIDKINSQKNNEDDEVFTGGIWKGKEYKVIVAEDGRKWLDRNLGADRVCQSRDDEQCYGWLFQWGRPADGHQLRDSETTYEQNLTPVPNNNKFVLRKGGNPYSGAWWRSYLKGLSDGRIKMYNNWSFNKETKICPNGFRLPTSKELYNWFILLNKNIPQDERTFQGSLKFPNPIYRSSFTGEVKVAHKNRYSSQTREFALWINNHYITDDSTYSAYAYAQFSYAPGYKSKVHINTGIGVRCIKDEKNTPLWALDGDGGGENNIYEIMNGRNPANPTDDIITNLQQILLNAGAKRDIEYNENINTSNWDYTHWQEKEVYIEGTRFAWYSKSVDITTKEITFKYPTYNYFYLDSYDKNNVNFCNAIGLKSVKNKKYTSEFKKVQVVTWWDDSIKWFKPHYFSSRRDRVIIKELICKLD